jgi:hypothetical protein
MSVIACYQQLPAKKRIIPIEVSNEGDAGCSYALGFREYRSGAHLQTGLVREAFWCSEGSDLLTEYNRMGF